MTQQLDMKVNQITSILNDRTKLQIKAKTKALYQALHEQRNYIQDKVVLIELNLQSSHFLYFNNLFFFLGKVEESNPSSY